MPNWDLVEPLERAEAVKRLAVVIAATLTPEQRREVETGGLAFDALARDQQVLLASFLEANGGPLEARVATSLEGPWRTVQLPLERWEIDTVHYNPADPVEFEFHARCRFAPGEEGFVGGATFGRGAFSGRGQAYRSPEEMPEEVRELFEE